MFNLTIDTVGTYQVKATSTGLTPVTSTPITITLAPVDQLVWATEPPSQVMHGAGFGAAIDMEDQYGNLETGYKGGVVIAIENNPGGANLGGTSAVTASGGVATFSGLTINEVGDGYTLVAVSAGLTSPTSTPIDVTPIPPVGMKVTTQPPTSVQVAKTFGLTVMIYDQFGVADPDFNGNVTVSIAGPAGSNTLAGTTTVAASGGVAKFPGLALDEVGAVTLNISSTGLSSITTNSINVTAAAASQLILITDPPSSVTAGARVWPRGGGGRRVRQPGHQLQRDCHCGLIVQRRQRNARRTDHHVRQ